MKLWKKISLVLLCILLLAQVPFLYSRYQTGVLAGRISKLAERRLVVQTPGFKDYKGVIHVHSSLGGHSTGTFDNIITAAKDNQLDFVVMTEHTSREFDTSETTLRGVIEGVLFVNGHEASTLDGRLLYLQGFSGAHAGGLVNTKAAIKQAHRENRLAFALYPERFKLGDEDIDGVEIFSLNTNSKKMNPVTFIPSVFWSLGYFELTLAKFFSRPTGNLVEYDALAKRKKLTLFAGNDAHSNLGFHIFGSDSGFKLLDLKFDKYESVFSLVRTHIVIAEEEKFTQENLLLALKSGNTFIGFDILSDTSGFSFTAENEGQIKIMGDELSLDSGEITLKSVAPQTSRFVLFRNGTKVFESKDTKKLSFEVREKGAYRIEVYLDVLGSPFDKTPWIISNPIYIRSLVSRYKSNRFNCLEMSTSGLCN